MQPFVIIIIIIIIIIIVIIIIIIITTTTTIIIIIIIRALVYFNGIYGFYSSEFTRMVPLNSGYR